MKPPPQLLVLFSLLFQAGGADDKTRCNEFLKNNISLKKTSPPTAELLTRYTNHVQYDRFLLHCYQWTDGNIKQYAAEITRPLGSHIATIKGFRCDLKENVFKKSYTFTISVEKNNYMGLGILLYEQSPIWCRYDICLDCKGSRSPAIVFNPETRPELLFFRWSEPGIQLTLNSIQDISETGSLVEEYRSIGESHLLLSCYKTDEGYRAIIKTTSGNTKKPLFKVDAIDCSPGKQHIQTIFDYRYYNDNDMTTKRLNHELNIAEGDANLQSRWLFYFIAQSPAKNCYWIPVGNTKVVKERYDDSTEREICLPKEKRPTELESFTKDIKMELSEDE